MEEVNTILVVTPHPDDAESGAGASIARWTQEGKKVVLVVCTDGRNGTSDRSVRPEDLAATREKEQREAAEVLGISEVVFLRIPDQTLDDTSDFREKLVRQIRTHRPEVVVTVDPNRKYIRHRDHHWCGRVTLDAVFPYARDYLSYPEHAEEGLEPHKVREVLLWGSDEPDLVLDATDTFDLKMKALSKHASQVGDPNPDREQRARTRYGAVGKKIGTELAEQFKLVEIFR